MLGPLRDRRGICSTRLLTTTLPSPSVPLPSATRRRCSRCGLPSTKTTVTALAELRNREINYDPSEVHPYDWNFDVHRSLVGRERPGPFVKMRHVASPIPE